MPKNKDLINDIKIVATEKNVDVPNIEGKSNAELATILKDLKAGTPPPPPEANKGKGDSATTKGNDDEGDPEPDEKPAFPYSVGAGKALTTKRGILADGDEIKKSDLGDAAFRAFIKSGHIKKG